MITINSKTYTDNEKAGYSFVGQIERWIEGGFLEEVKENKEHPMIKCVRADLLREELDKMKTENTDTSDEYTQGVLNTCGYLLDLLSSLETKEEPVPPTDKGREQYIADHPDELSQLQTFASPDKFKAMREQPQFTPGQMIEVSNDGEKWEQEPRKFVKNNPTGGYEVEYKGLTSMTDYFEYARPLQPQEDIELQKLVEIGDFDYMKITDGENYKFATLAKQVEALTKSNNTLVSVVNQLIKANKK